MIFSGGLAEKVLDGTKTVTRRPTKFGEDECRYKVGQTYAVQPRRGHHQVGRIKVLSVSLDRPNNISQTEAEREGFDSAQGFFDKWVGLYGGVRGFCWRIEFELVGEPQ